MLMKFSNQAARDALIEAYDLILPMCNTKNSGVCNDPKKSYYSKVEGWSVIYSYQIGLSDYYLHVFKPAKLNNMSIGMFASLEIVSEEGEMIKCTRKLCNNNTMKKKGEDGYNLAYKSGSVWRQNYIWTHWLWSIRVRNYWMSEIHATCIPALSQAPQVATWLDYDGFGDAITCRRDWLHDNIPGEYLHKKKTDTSEHFFNPVVAVRHLEAVIEKTIDAN
eukprot:5276332-Ditylum_brightwellii.AAC.1